MTLKALKNIKYASSVDKTAEINRYANYVYDNSVQNFTHEYDRNSLVKLKNSI